MKNQQIDLFFGLGLAKLNKLPKLFPNLFSTAQIEFTESMRQRFHNLHNRIFSGLGVVQKDSELTKLTNKMQKGGLRPIN